jgi:hypothetical protein
MGCFVSRMLGAALLVTVCACSGGSGGGKRPDPDPDPGGARLTNSYCSLVLDETGAVESLRLLPDGEELSLAGAFMEADHGGTTFAATSLTTSKGDIVVRFEGLSGRLRIAVETEPGHIVFRIREASIPDLEAVRLRIPIRFSGVFDSPMNGRYNDVSAVCLRPVTANTLAKYFLKDKVLTLGVEWVARRGIVGGAAALVATPRANLLDAIEALETAEGLPSPHFDGVRARESAAARESYLFLTYYVPGDVDALIEYAKVGGFGTILFLRNLWRETGGTYAIDTARFPGGLAEFTSVCDEIHAAGLGVGVHLYGPSVSIEDPLVSPVPADGFLTWACPDLATAVGAADASLVLAGAPDLPATGRGGYPGTYVRVGDEIIRYTALSSSPPYTLSGCERGTLGTVASAHASGAPVGHLATTWSMFLIDPDGPLVQTVANNLGAVVNAAKIDFVYFDGAAFTQEGKHVDGWYYMNRLLPAHVAAFDHPVLVQTSLGPGRQLSWHIVPRSASADGHGDIKWYLDQRTPAIESFLRGFTVPDVGWYGFDQGRPPDHLEYIAARCMGWGGSLSLQTYKIALENDSRSRETMEMLGRYERCKWEGGLPENILATLPTPGQDFRLLEGDPRTWHLFKTAYLPEEPVRLLEGGDHHVWTVTNPEAYNRKVGVEIVRGGAIHVDARIDEPGHMDLDDFEAVDAYATGGDNDFTRLVNWTDPWVSTQGMARKGVDHELTVSGDARIGATCATLSTDNQSVGTGWCAVGRRLATPVDISGMKALGLWLHGDGNATTLRIELWDDANVRAQVRAPIHFSGWRLHTWALSTPAAFDRTKVRYLVFILSDLPLHGTAEVKLDGFRALPTLRPAVSLAGATIRIGSREVTLPADLPPEGTARIDALGRLTIWPGGMATGQTWVLPDGPILIGTGTRHARFTLADPSDYPGDVAVRVSFLDTVHPK